MNSAIGYSEGAEVPEDKTKDRIEKEAISYVIRETGYQVLPKHDHWKKAYIAGATAERNKAIDECIALVFQEDGDFQHFKSPAIVKQELESLKNKPI